VATAAALSGSRFLGMATFLSLSGVIWAMSSLLSGWPATTGAFMESPALSSAAWVVIT
jgi:hypothetical protein